MSVRFILGRAGSGKTQYCLQAVRERLQESQEGEPLALLVPEQATFEMSRALLGGGALPGYCRSHVLSFRRLAHHVFTEVGGPSLPPAGSVARQMIIARILAQNEKKLLVFRPSARTPGLAARLASLITEVHRHRWSRERITGQLGLLRERGAGRSLLSLKLQDVLLVHDAYHDWLSERYSDPDDFLDLLADKVPQSALVADAHVWVDGFAGFTPQEYHVLEKMIGQARQFEVALCLDPAEIGDLPESPADLDRTRLFHPTEETYLTLRAMCRRLGKEVETVALPRPGQETRFSRRPALAHVEKEIFNFPSRPRSGGHEEIALVEAADPRAEVDAAAREILRLCKEENYRYRDIALIVRDFDNYHELVNATFSGYGIPCFVDRRREVTHHPLVELVRSAARVAAEDWPTEAVIQYLKTDLAPLGREEADVLENYVLEHGITGRRWHDGEKWLYRRTPDLEEAPLRPEEESDLETVNRLRDKGTAELREFHDRTAGKPHSAREIAGALFRLLEDLGAAERIETWRTEAERRGDLDLAAEHAQIWNDLLALLDEMVDVLGETPMTISEYADVLDAGLSGMTLGLVPPVVDQVLVGSIERSRHPDIRAALVVGVGEGILPKRRSQDPIFTDGEREQLAKDGVPIGLTAETHAYHERFLAYIAFTRPKDYLWISYPTADLSGKKLNASLFVDYLSQCLGGMTPQKVGAQDCRERLDAVWTKPQLASAVAHAFRQGGRGLADWRAAYNEVLARPGGADAATRRVLSSLLYSNSTRPLPKAIIEMAYPDRTIPGSASQFQAFRACPFQYFARHILRLKTREPHVLLPHDIGSLHHAVLRQVFVRIIGDGLDLRKMPVERARQLVDAAVDNIAPRVKSEILLSDGRGEYIKNDCRRVLRDLIAVMVAQARVTEFQPAACELDFGGRSGGLPALEIELPHGFTIRIRGRMDRVDIADLKGARAVRVIDYKSSAGAAPLFRIVHGLHLQLPLYLVALKEKGQVKFRTALVPAGAFLQPITPQGMEESSAGEAQEVPPLCEEPRRYKPRGFFKEEFIEALDGSVGPAEWSQYLPLYVNKDGKPGAKGDWLPGLAVDRILDLAVRHIRDIGERLCAGEMPITPYRIGRETPCAQCDYAGVCRFSPAEGKHRELRRGTRKEWMEMLLTDPETLWREVLQKKQ